jgi:SAM-dependent methyltransferase
VRAPSRAESHYLHFKSLALTLARAIERNVPVRAGQTLVDVGAGLKPYYPYFTPYVEDYIGIDFEATTSTDICGAAEMLPLQDESADIILSTQVLEHVNDPAATVREWRRVLRPGGLVIASTHGSIYYHPIPNDHWRWTHTGLRKLLEDANLKVRTVEPCERTLTVLAFQVAIHIHDRARFLGFPRLADAILQPMHLLVEKLDHIDCSRRPKESDVAWGSMPVTYVAVAEK